MGALFVLLAEMRTGSNFLEAQLNALPGVRCHGEAFNPHFMGEPNRTEMLGVTQAARDADPGLLLGRLRAEPGLNGFRLFGDHDPRALGLVLPDPAIAKIVLTRSPLESYVSLKLARATGQWRLTGGKARRETVRFDAAEFGRHLDRLQETQLTILRGLQATGQTAFWLGYEDIQEIEVIRGLALWLGVPPPAALDRRLRKQNPEPLDSKIENFDEMVAALAALDRWDLHRTPSFEPRRGPAVPTALAAAASPLLVLPVPGGPDLSPWLAALDAAPPQGGFALGTLKRWKAARPGHLTVTALRHPLQRAHWAFCERVLAPDAPGELRANLRRGWGLEAPEGGVAGWSAWGEAEHRRGFESFLAFLKANLGGQTSLRTDPAWASQLALVQGFAQLHPPDLVLREEDLPEELPRLARRLGRPAPPWAGGSDPHAARLGRIHDDRLEALAREACARDFAAWGWGRWQPDG